MINNVIEVKELTVNDLKDIINIMMDEDENAGSKQIQVMDTHFNTSRPLSKIEHDFHKVILI